MALSQKPFSAQLAGENDMLAKRIVCDYLLSTGHYTLEVPMEEQSERYKECDFTLRHNSSGRQVLVEVERKKVWVKSGGWEGYPTIDVPYRKKDSKSDLFAMVNRDCNTLAITRMGTVTGSKVENKKTIYTESEPFFKVPVSAFKFCHRKWEDVPAG